MPGAIAVKIVKAILATAALMFLMGQGCATGGLGIGPDMGGAPMAGDGAQCPSGTYRTIDTMGNKVCRSSMTGQDVTTARGASGCPNGAYPTIDSMGNKVCRNDMTGQTFYDTSRGGPMGTHPGMDTYGKRVCQPN